MALLYIYIQTASSISKLGARMIRFGCKTLKLAVQDEIIGNDSENDEDPNPDSDSSVMTKKIVMMMMWLTLLVMMITIVIRMMIKLMGHQIVIWVMKQTIVKNSM